MIFAIIAVILLVAWLLWLPYLKKTTKFGAPYVPMEKAVVNRILQMVKVGETDILYDLGSGDGRVVIAAAKAGVKQAIGIEIDPIKVFLSRLHLKLLGLNNARIIKGDFFAQNLKSTTIVISYLLPQALEKLEPKLQKELKPGTKIISVGFPYPHWQPKTIDPRGTRYGPIYLYSLNQKTKIDRSN